MTWAIVALAVVLLLYYRSKRRLTGWHIMYSPGMPDRPTMQGDGWHFDFPTDPASHVHYVQWFKPPSPVGALTARFTVTGSGFVPQEFPDRAATVSLLLQRRGDDWTARGAMQSYRWYSSEVVTLAAGEFELTVPLDVAFWGDVNGFKDPVAFAATLADLDNIGLVFGSAGGRGHGVYATEPARFAFSSFSS